MRFAPWPVLVLAGTLVTPHAAPAEDGGGTARRALVVAYVGPSHAVTVGDIEDRLARMPSFQRAQFGETPDAVRHRFLTDVLIPEALLTLGAEANAMAGQLPTSYAIERTLSTATIRAIRAAIGPASAIPMDDVRAYYEKNRARYDAPERYQIWRILCATRQEALSVLDEASRDPTPVTFSRLAREHSEDKATHLRGGNVGFLTAEGTSTEPGLRVDPAVVRAAQSVRDGDLVRVPVPEGEHFAVVWRRGTLAATKRSVEDVAAQIRDALWKARVKEQTDAKLASLRAANLHAVNEELLEGIADPEPPRRVTRGGEL